MLTLKKSKIMSTERSEVDRHDFLGLTIHGVYLLTICIITWNGFNSGNNSIKHLRQLDFIVKILKAIKDMACSLNSSLNCQMLKLKLFICTGCLQQNKMATKISHE